MYVGLVGSAALQELERQADDIDFRLAVVAVTLLRYLTEHITKLPLAVMTRLLDTHGMPRCSNLIVPCASLSYVLGAMLRCAAELGSVGGEPALDSQGKRKVGKIQEPAMGGGGALRSSEIDSDRGTSKRPPPGLCRIGHLFTNPL